MRLPGQESGNIEDRRGGGMGGVPVVGGGLGMVVIIVLGLLFGVDPFALLEAINGPAVQQSVQQQKGAPAGGDGAEDPMRRFVAQVLATTEDSWGEVFRTAGAHYEAPRLVLFSRVTQSACGTAQSATGPFYCPNDQRVYIDLDFLEALQRHLHAPGDFARAYVIAHEVGHHVQKQMGILDKVDAVRQRSSQQQSNALSVRIELQADCFAGIWANRTQQRHRFLEAGDIEQGLNAAAAVGDDRLQRQAGGTVSPESFTHGSAAQRVRWFRQGLDSGDIRACDTFAASQP